MKLVIVYTLWLAYSAYEGVVEGFLWEIKNTNTIYSNLKTHLHAYFTIKRMIVGVLIMLNFHYGFVQYILLGMCLVGSFSFFHNGIMYMTRNSMNRLVYSKRFTDYSTTSTSIFEINFHERLYSFVGATLVITTLILLHDKIF